MFASIIISGGDGITQFSYDLMASSSSVMLEKGTWRDEVATPNTSLLNPRPYNDCVVSCSVTILGTSERDVWTKYNEFVALLQQIAVQPIHPAYNPIVLKMRVSDTSPIYQAKIVGSPDRNPQTTIVSPATNAFQDSDSMWMIRNVGVSFLREGLYRGDETTRQFATFARFEETEYAVPVLTFPTNKTVKSPIDFDIRAYGGSTGNIPSGHLILSNPHQSNAYRPTIQVLPALTKIGSGNAGNGTFSSFSRTGQVNPLSGAYASDLLQWQASNNSFYSHFGGTGYSSHYPPSQFLVLGLLRSDIANSEAAVSVSFMPQSVDYITKITSETKIIKGNANLYPEVVNFGIVSINKNLVGAANRNFILAINIQNLSTALSKIIFDAFILIDLNVDHLTYIMHGEIPQSCRVLLTDEMIVMVAEFMPSPLPFDDGKRSAPTFTYGLNQPHYRYKKVYCLWLNPRSTEWNNALFTPPYANSIMYARSQTGALVPRGDS